MEQTLQTEALDHRPKAVARPWRWGLISLCWIAWGLFYAARLRLEVPDIDWQRALIYALPDAFLWMLLTPIPVFLYRRFPFSRGRRLVHTSVHLLASVAVAVMHSASDTVLNLLQEPPGSNLGVVTLFQHLFSHGLHINVLLYFTIVGIAHYLARMESLREERRRASELRAQLSEARLEALRLQLRPHFLFNALNTISGLMEQDPSTGQRLVRELGELLRASLAEHGSREIPLRRELELARAYLDIEQVRFEDRLTTAIEVPDEVLDCLVPPFILQPILENAVRHGLPPEGGGTVEVSAAQQDGKLELRVLDNGPGMASHEGGHGIGIANTRARLAELYGDGQDLRIEPRAEGGLAVTMTLPRRGGIP